MFFRGASPSPSVQRRRRIALVLAGAVVLAVIAGGAGVMSGLASQPTPPAPAAPVESPAAPESADPRPSPMKSADPQRVSSFDMRAFSIDDPASIWVVVNKTRPLTPADYAPADLVNVPVAHTWDPMLRAEASSGIQSLFAAASAEAGLTLASNSAYRSYQTQVGVYNDDVAANGQAFADTSTARPGTSEHQTGLTMDIGAASGVCSLATCFADTAEGQWLAQNAWRFGFLLRYPADKTEVTGYAFEPWHYRYVGTALSTRMHETGVATLEEFFGLPAAPTY